MKQIFLIFIISMAAVSCGSKNDTGKASFKLKLGNLTNAPASYFPGGLILTGHRLDDSQSFSLAYTDGLQLELQKGAWEFATVGWTNATNGPMTGPQQCSYQLVELRDDNQAISFSMSGAKCRSIGTTDGSQLTDSLYFKLTNSSGTIGFKKLNVIICNSFDGSDICSPAYGSSTINSYKVSIPAKLKGVVATTAPTLDSNCFALSGGYSYSDLTLPYGGAKGFMRTDISLFTSGDCSGTPVTKSYSHGFAETVSNSSIMSFSNSSFNYDRGNYQGIWSNGSSTPSTPVKGDIYTMSTFLTVSPYSNSGESMYFNGSIWINLYTSMTPVDGRPYIDDIYAGLYIKP